MSGKKFQQATTTFPSGTGLHINATTAFGGTFYLLAAPSFASPLQWTPILTNSVTTRGANNFSVALPNVNSSAQFYILQSQ